MAVEPGGVEAGLLLVRDADSTRTDAWADAMAAIVEKRVVEVTENEAGRAGVGAVGRVEAGAAQ